ncbi:FAD-dependent monooxygenase [Knoellia sp. p5-6-4]|uniref:FAD-dependent monooxygenase n=1 Tax=unclassified Knoellia TaxID=2618719 RepID=UPI0023DB8DD9|nr:FAD-dependent monooxygenase [Knoellia sp. p5-6-4]MDF2143770.1 FAD-dependent monooxygenase [Knoellia sp. p5-6-4]
MSSGAGPTGPRSAGRVAVIGNGPVGQTTALLLAGWGVHVVLLDRRPARDPVGSKAICQQRDVLDVWASCGGERIAQEGLTWSRARTFYREHELFCVELQDPGRSPFPPFVNISQARTEEILDEAIAAQPLIEERWGHEVVGLDQELDDRVVVHCETSAGPVDVEAAYAVACGGARGRQLRELLGVGFEGRSFADSFLICDIRAELPGWENERRFYFDPVWNPGRQVLIHPCPGGLYRIDWQVDPSFDLDRARADGSLDVRIRQVVGDRSYEVDWTSLYTFHARVADRFRVGRVLLAGDLAHLVAPFGARGLNSGVGDADNAAWKIAFVLRGWAGEALLDSYESERRAAAVENLGVTSATMDFLVPHSPEGAARRRELLEAAVTDPAVHERVDSGRLAEPFWYVDSELTTPHSARHWPGRPPRGQAPAPVPGVIIPDAPVRDAENPGVTHIRQLCRSGLLVLLGDAGQREAAAKALDDVLPPELPRRIVPLDEIDTDGILRTALRMEGSREMWLVRPDAHLAACVATPKDLAAAARRLLPR